MEVKVKRPKMKTTLFALLIFLTSFHSFSQTTGPWQRPLVICTSQDGINFSSCNIFQDSSGVPSVAMDSIGRLISAFQWFPDPFHGPHWDSVAVKISLDSGISWTDPQPIIIQNFPSNYQRPFDPTLVALPGGQIRIYFSSGPPGMNTIGTYSAISIDGINYTYEPGIRFSQAGRNCIDPAVIIFQGNFHYTSPKGAPQDGAFHAISPDGLNFTQLADIPSDNQHNWTGNMMVDSLALKFYGTGGPFMWFSATGNGSVWSPYQNLNLSGGDPAIVKIWGNKFILIYTGTPLINGIAESNLNMKRKLYPNPAKNILHVSGEDFFENLNYVIIDLFGNELQKGWLSKHNNEIPLHGFSDGTYILKITDSNEIFHSVFQVFN